jgi:hypothetical protein
MLLLGAGVLGLAFCAPRAGAADGRPPAISFNVLKLKQENVEGPDVERTYFAAGAKRIVFGIPKGCRLSMKDGGLLILLMDAGLDGEILVKQSTFTPEMALAANALKYREAAAKEMPQGAAQVEVQQPVMNPYPYNGWTSLGFTWSYASSGRPMVRTVSYINLEIGVQIVVTTLAVKNDAEKVDKIAKQFMSSWWVMDAGRG